MAEEEQPLDADATFAATKRLRELRPRMVCPFCQSEDSFLHQLRAKPLRYAFTIFNTEKKDFEQAYFMDLITCHLCGYTMSFLPPTLERYLQKLEDEQQAQEGGEEPANDGDT